jgi:hypothetical protein
MVALLKLNEIQGFLKNFNKGGLFNKWVSEAKQTEGKAA